MNICNKLERFSPGMLLQVRLMFVDRVLKSLLTLGPGAGPQPLVEGFVPIRIFRPITFEHNGILPNVKIPKVLPSIGLTSIL